MTRGLAGLLVLMVLVSGACRGVDWPGYRRGKWTPEPPQPTKERIRELMTLTGPPPERAVLTDVQVSAPRFILAGQSAEVICRLPTENTIRALRLELQGARALSEAYLDKPAPPRESMVITGIPCGDHLVICRVVDAQGTVTQRTTTVTARGECNAGSDW